ncbi:hypothetical protein PT286_02075 [Neisseriaceae bacterium ESL0693]|nr:hypothetical protein [Neisseriaceae bacterium ESL0693]
MKNATIKTSAPLVHACFEKTHELNPGFLLLSDSLFQELLHAQLPKPEKAASQLHANRERDLYRLHYLRLFTKNYIYILTQFKIDTSEISNIQEIIQRQCIDIF